MWQIISEARRTEDGADYTAYGVCIDGFCIQDICSSMNDIVRFAGLLNMYQASPANAADVADDFLAGGFDFPEDVLAVTA